MGVRESGDGNTETYRVVLNSAPTANVTIAVTSGATTAATVNPTSLTFTTTGSGLWSTPQTVTVTGVADSTSGNERTTTITHTATSTDTNYNNLTIDSVDVTVTDLPLISLGMPATELSEGRREGFRVYTEVQDALMINGTSTPAPSAALTVCVRGEERFARRITSWSSAIITNTWTFSVEQSSLTSAILFPDDSDDERDSLVTFEIVLPSDSDCSATGYTVHPDAGELSFWIRDDDSTPVSLSSGGDLDMTEGDATDTATVTVGLARRLYGGETAVVPINLATTIGAHLPNSLARDFTVSVSGDGASLTDATSTSPDVVFTGDDDDTVQTATVTLHADGEAGR